MRKPKRSKGTGERKGPWVLSVDFTEGPAPPGFSRLNRDSKVTRRTKQVEGTLEQRPRDTATSSHHQLSKAGPGSWGGQRREV